MLTAAFRRDYAEQFEQFHGMAPSAHRKGASRVDVNPVPYQGQGIPTHHDLRPQIAV